MYYTGQTLWHRELSELVMYIGIDEDGLVHIKFTDRTTLSATQPSIWSHLTHLVNKDGELVTGSLPCFRKEEDKLAILISDDSMGPDYDIYPDGVNYFIPKETKSLQAVGKARESILG